MRMRKKRNLEKRIESCSGMLFDIRSDELDFIKAREKKEYLDFSEYFKNDNPLELEIGCGKGSFICEKAKRNPGTNFLAAELCANVIVQACERAQRENIENILFIKGNAEYLPKYIPEKSLEKIYLNFSCPFPKAKYASHRLTHSHFLLLYKNLLAPGGEIHQKTDNMDFFEFSIEEFSRCGFALKNVSLDLHADNPEDNIVTEYESRFTSLGLPIYRLEAYIP